MPSKPAYPKLELSEEPLIIVTDADKLISSENKRSSSLNAILPSNKAVNNLAITQSDVNGVN